MSDQCKTEDDCDHPMWCSGKDTCRKAGSRDATCSRCSDLQKEVEALRSAIRLASAKFDAVDWGWDGDCGSRRIIEELEDILPENAKAQTPPSNT